MNRNTATRDAWHPHTREDREAVAAELQEILASPHFCNSKRYPALLRYIVEKALAGEGDSLKERTIGVEVFDRSPSYDTNADTVVRYTAGEVRKRLALRYHELDHKPSIQISLPAGSYVPEFLHLERDTADQRGLISSPSQDGVHDPDWVQHPETLVTWSPGQPQSGSMEIHQVPTRSAIEPTQNPLPRWPVVLAVLVCIVLLGGFGWRYRTAQSQIPLDRFWAPILHDHAAIPICIGGSVFSQTHISGVATATKDIDYPFVSMQSASAVAQISALMARSGDAGVQLQASATTPLNELREHPVVLLGGYNNEWTLRLLQPLRFHFAPPELGQKIVDDAHPGTIWERDASLPYSSADDYALIARYREPTTDSWIVALAGIGRNGTEAAAQFATSPRYMAMLKDALGADFSNRNIEAIVKVHVIDGKTGAPAIVAVHLW